MNYPRRKLLCVLATLLASTKLPSLAWASPADGPVSNDAALNQFIRLSEVLTGTDQLDRETAGKILERLQTEPWGREHLAQITPKILGPDAPTDRQKLFDKTRYTEGEHWFIGHVLTTWFTGIYYHQTNYAISYRYALMHAAIQDVRPVPGHCNGEFGFWSQPPQGAKL